MIKPSLNSGVKKSLIFCDQLWKQCRQRMMWRRTSFCLFQQGGYMNTSRSQLLSSLNKCWHPKSLVWNSLFASCRKLARQEAYYILHFWIWALIKWAYCSNSQPAPYSPCARNRGKMLQLAQKARFRSAGILPHYHYPRQRGNTIINLCPDKNQKTSRNKTTN